MRALFFSFLVLLTGATGVFAFESNARSAFVVDQTTGTVLYAKDADSPLPPASMSKLMTLNMIFEALRAGRITPDTKILVSERAHAMKGSSMFLRVGERVAIKDLILGIIVQSGNDACVAVAEGLEGTEAEFAAKMTKRAQELGMSGSTFANASGWPHPGQRMSARDLVFLANRLMTEFPEYYTYFKERSFTWDGITQENRNPLLGLGIGADGLKTGHTEEAGYGLVGSAVQGDRRIIFMITGLGSKLARAQEAERITNWAFRQFVMKEMVKGGTRIAEAPVWIGKAPRVGLVAAQDIRTVVPYDHSQEIAAVVSYDSPIEAPIVKGDKIASLTLTPKDMEPLVIPLVAETDVPAGGILPLMRASAEVLGREVIGKRIFNRGE